MTAIRIFNVHRRWEDGIGIGIGVLIVLSPWLANAADSQVVVMNAVIVGTLVLSLAAMEIMAPGLSEEWSELACGLWLGASPFILGYADSGELRSWHLALGALVVVLAALELWQDWNPSDEEFAPAETGQSLASQASPAPRAELFQPHLDSMAP